MNRLTSERMNGIKAGYWSPAKKEDLINRLAEYENIGLTTEQIGRMIDKYITPRMMEEVKREP